MQFDEIKKWKDISLNPNSKDVLEFRRRLLLKARRKELIINRTDYFCSLANGKNVLDVGVVEHFSKSSEDENWLHGKLCHHSKTCLGVDILEQEVKVLAAQGYNVILWDLTDKALPNKFDLIIVGDVVEHLENPSALFRNLSHMLQPHGRIVISTPNPWYVNVVVKNFKKGYPFTDSADHVGWYDASTLCEIASRTGLVLIKYSGVRTTGARTFFGRFFLKLASFFVFWGVRPEFFSKTMIYEFALPH